jgi:cell division septum initiation protein DivIVA
MTDQYLKVIDAPGLLRDPHSKAIVAADSDALLAHRKKKQAMRAILNKNTELKQEVDQLKDQLQRLESIVSSLVAKSIEK